MLLPRNKDGADTATLVGLVSVCVPEVDAGGLLNKFPASAGFASVAGSSFFSAGLPKEKPPGLGASLGASAGLPNERPPVLGAYIV